MKTLLIPLFMAALLCAGCNQSSTPNEDKDSSVKFTGTDHFTPAAADTSKAVLARLAGQSWKLERWTGADGSEQEVGAITLAVGDNFHISGNASVNRYMGQASFTQSEALDLSQGLATTMMMGLPEAMEREKRYLADLKLVSEARLDNGRLILSGGEKLRLEFAPAQ